MKLRAAPASKARWMLNRQKCQASNHALAVMTFALPNDSSDEEGHGDHARRSGCNALVQPAITRELERYGQPEAHQARGVDQDAGARV
jgi:hypothetical protein